MNKTDWDKLKIGSGILDIRDTGRISYIVVKIQQDSISCCQNYRLWRSTILYNNRDAQGTDQHNIPLTDSPPPFSEINHKLYCCADFSNLYEIDKTEFLQNYSLSDNEQTVSEHDLKLIFDHDLRQQQLEKRRNRRLANEPSEQEENTDEYEY